jgi:ankyrin repeat protein
MNSVNSINNKNILFIQCCNYKNADKNSIDNNEEKMYVFYNSILYLLKKYKIDLTIKNENGFNLFQIILYSDFYDHIKYKIIELLFEYGMNINDKDSNGNTIIYTIISLNEIYLLKLLIKMGCDINVCNNEMITPLHYAIILNKIPMIQILLNNNAIINGSNNPNKNYFFKCILHNKYIILNMLFEHYKKKGVSIENKKKMTLYHLCIVHSNEITISPILFDILKNNDISIDDCDSNHYSVLQYAISHNKMNMIHFLLKNNVNIEYKNKNGNSALHIAANNLQYSIIKLLLESGANINATNYSGNSILHSIMKNGDNNIEDISIVITKIMNLLLHNSSLDINIKNNEGNSILHCAIEENKYEYINMILEYAKNIDLNIRNKEGLSLLHMCVKHNNIDLLNIFLGMNIDKSLVTNKKKTLFHYIVRNRSIKMLELLLSDKDNKKYMNHKDINGFTPFFITVKHNNIRYAKYIMENCKVDIELKNNKGISPLEYALSNNFSEIVEFLLDHATKDE